MLRILRENSQSFIVYLVFAPIIVVFAVTFGPGSSSCGGAGSQYAAVVNGDTIRQQDFTITYNQRFEMMRRQMRGMEFTQEMADGMGLRQQVLDQLIAQKLLAQQAAKWDLMVSNDELAEHLETVYGVKDVDYNAYVSWVRRTFALSVPKFEEQVRRELLGQKLARVLTDNVQVSDDELWQAYERERDRIKFDFVKIDPAGLDAPPLTDEDINALVEADMAAIEARFEQDKLKYHTPMQVQGRQIVLRLPRDASDAEVSQARAKLLELREQIEQGADFAALAKEHSQDASTAEKGGDMGFVRRGQLARDLEAALFELKEGEMVKEPVRTPMGLHLVLADTIKPPAAKELDEVKRDVARSILKDNALDAQANKQAQELLTQLKDGQTLASMTISEADALDDESGKLVRNESPWITRTQESLPRIGVAPHVRDALFELSLDEPLAKEPFKVGRAYYVAVLTDKEAPDREQFTSEIDSLRESAVWTKRNKVLEDWVGHLREQATVKLNPQLFGTDDKQS